MRSDDIEVINRIFQSQTLAFFITRFGIYGGISLTLTMLEYAMKHPSTRYFERRDP